MHEIFIMISRYFSSLKYFSQASNTRLLSFSVHLYIVKYLPSLISSPYNPHFFNFYPCIAFCRFSFSDYEVHNKKGRTQVTRVKKHNTPTWDTSTRHFWLTSVSFLVFFLLPTKYVTKPPKITDKSGELTAANFSSVCYANPALRCLRGYLAAYRLYICGFSGVCPYSHGYAVNSAWIFCVKI